jgi:hypothetical protein
MKNLRQPLILLALVAMLGSPLSLLASGTYCACMPKPPLRVKGAQVDRDRYDLGQKVYNEKTAPGQGDAASQRTRLQALQAQLPESIAKKKNLTSMAGKLTEQQLSALEYYVQQRYPKSK